MLLVYSLIIWRVSGSVAGELAAGGRERLDVGLASCRASSGVSDELSDTLAGWMDEEVGGVLGLNRLLVY